MAISNATVTAARCDGCPAVIYAEAPARPKGISGSAQRIEGDGRETNAPWFACQDQHIGKAVQNALKGATPVDQRPRSYQKPEDSYS